ncbi:hypothetical protein SBF1_50004 [Candidatus Desulfosporosinus infrequens]|uniref:Zinc ribbon domain-containing protein n=1 Tax=Candidatus Desulfosporosinus infrequens TaxID=2043169 RepID=A0A2U3LH06_9FIRM|nr:hypothetical protein SBF1_50004 [Candidatus Desulfosporosinus infrequens]
MNDEIVGYVCPICDTPNPLSTNYCLKCGHWLLDTNTKARPIAKREYKRYFKNNSIGSKVVSIIKWLVVAILLIFVVMVILVACHLPSSTTNNVPVTKQVATLSPADFKTQSITIPYDDIARQTEDYVGKKTILTGQVIQIEEGPNNQIIMRVNMTKGQYGIYKDTVWVDYTYKQGEKRFLEKDIVNIWGSVTGRKTYTSAMKVDITIPEINAYIIEMAPQSNT